MADESAAPKLHIDSDWKAQAQREKEKLVQKEQARAETKPASAKTAGAAPGDPSLPPGEGELPDASFRTLMSMLASQAIMGLGGMADQQTGRVMIDLEGARFSIDLLDVLEQKTKGNLTAEETAELKRLLAELRSRYVKIAQLVAKQMAAQQAGVMPGAAPGIPGVMPSLRS